MLEEPPPAGASEAAPERTLDEHAGSRARWWGGGALWVQAGAVLAAWLVALIVENIAVTALFRGEFAGSWEVRSSRRLALPFAFGALLPAALLAAVVARAAEARRAGLAVAAGVAGGAVGWGVSYGRHMASLAARVPFVAAVAAASAALTWWALPLMVRAARARPSLVALAGTAAAGVAWFADAHVLPRLYPAFHVALFALTLGAGALSALTLRPRPGDETAVPAVVAATALLAAVASAAFAPKAARLLAGSDNLRWILGEHAPLAGRAVWLAARMAPPPPDEPAEALGAPPGELPRALDWTGHDIVLLTIDALRADHVSAYGYSRPTTPNLDALAGEGARLDAAYCPTPHTSYSIASLMTGKYMRPLVAMGLGDDSDTWAGLVRRYGYRTAAFFPPAVFFIDGERFTGLHERGLDFEYRKEEFAAPDPRAAQVASYLAEVPRDAPLFLWVHFFEPHEPYVAHPEHPFGPSDVDRYDSEIAATDDGVGRIVAAVRARRPGAVILATADHGEEFGEHGGRYHGTTVYEEQVRVPLIVVGPGVPRGATASVVQTIDLLPTVLSALGIPRPARLRGRDLGSLLAGRAPDDPGLAFAETDEYTLLARGDARLVCARRASACALFDRARDPFERRDVASAEPDRARELRGRLRAVESEHGRFEHGEEAAWPEALRRGMAGDADAAGDVAALLDDASRAIRRKAAEVCFDLHTPAVAASMRRAAAGDDEEVSRWSALALVRMGEPPPPLAEALLLAPEDAWRRRAALAFAERGDRRGASELAGWWGARNEVGDVGYVRATEILAALGKIRDRAAIEPLVRSLEDVRMRPFVADALGKIGDPAARDPLAAALATEAQVTSRAHEARALLALGGAQWASPGSPREEVAVTLDAPRATRPLRLVVLTAADGPCEAKVGGRELPPSTTAISCHVFDLEGPPGQDRPRRTARLSLEVRAPAGVEALFLVESP